MRAGPPACCGAAAGVQLRDAPDRPRPAAHIDVPPQARARSAKTVSVTSSPATECPDPGPSYTQKRKWRSRPVSRVLSRTVIPLGASSPIRSSNLPGDTAGSGIVSLFGLAPGGVCRAGPLPDSRCALTAPFHPCPHSTPPFGDVEPLAVSFCCTFRRLAPPRRYLAPCPVEPGLSSAPREG